MWYSYQHDRWVWMATGEQFAHALWWAWPIMLITSETYAMIDHAEAYDHRGTPYKPTPLGGRIYKHGHIA
jgi:hypothetical protein